MYGPRAASNDLSLIFQLQTICAQLPRMADKRRLGIEADALALRRRIARANASMDPTHGGRVKHLYRVVRVDETLRNIVLANPILRIILRIGCVIGDPSLDAS